MFNAKKFLKTVPHLPGIYQMFDAAGNLLYVGKAKDLRKRLASYFNIINHPARVQSFVDQIAQINTTLTTSEVEALLLEYNLIKTLQPEYNIVWRDNRSYPYLFLSKTQYPSLAVHRGAKKEKGFYFGPFTSGLALRETLLLLQKIFQLRQCRESTFKNRSRPCLQYQIGRCSAPCVDYITGEEYARQVDFLKRFLQGKSKAVIRDIKTLMRKAAQQHDFEKAALYRDQIFNLEKISEEQYIISNSAHGNIDVVAIEMIVDQVAISLLMVRNGLVLGNKSFVNKNISRDDAADVLMAFLVQYYSNRHEGELPHELLLNIAIPTADQEALEKLFLQACGQRIKVLIKPANSAYKHWMDLAVLNARERLRAKSQEEKGLAAIFIELQRVLNLDVVPKIIECFDISHHGGEGTVASCIAFSARGPEKNRYRHYNIRHAAAGDDYAALKEALQRHFQELQAGKLAFPDVLLMDGGRGQLMVACEVLQQLILENTDIDEPVLKMAVLSIAKGEGRKRESDKIFMAECIRPLQVQKKLFHQLDLPTEIMNFLARLRDEAHRFAITAQRKGARKRRLTSKLETISGIGKKRSDELLKYFGGWQGVVKAEVAEISKVPGISNKLAKQIYEALH